MSPEKCVPCNMLGYLCALCALSRDEGKPEWNRASVCSVWRIESTTVPQNRDPPTEETQASPEGIK